MRTDTLLVVVVAVAELVLEGVIQEVEVPEVPVEVVPVQALLELLPPLRERLILEVAVVADLLATADQESLLFNIQNKEVKLSGALCSNW